MPSFFIVTSVARQSMRFLISRGVASKVQLYVRCIYVVHGRMQSAPPQMCVLWLVTKWGIAHPHPQLIRWGRFCGDQKLTQRKHATSFSTLHTIIRAARKRLKIQHAVRQEPQRPVQEPARRPRFRRQKGPQKAQRIGPEQNFKAGRRPRRKTRDPAHERSAGESERQKGEEAGEEDGVCAKEENGGRGGEADAG